ncbi:MAG TPA: Crp/Fnr family transcriptional regulator [Woeseiaceae bacterium]|nr:Crp/Fnr family transcriptional regulator [Woeseiaceae bacterium]
MPVNTTPGWMPRLLQAYPALGSLTSSAADQIKQQGVFVHKHAGDIMFEPRDFSVRYPFVLRGVARVLKVGRSAPDTLLYRLPAGEHCLLSASGLMAHWHFGARVVAEVETEVVLIPAALFRQLVRESSAFAHSVYVGIAHRLETVMDLVEQATYFRLDQRLATLILAGGSPLNKTHQELADDLGVSRENVSRVLSELRGRGWIRLGRRRIDTLDAKALRVFLDEADANR